MSRQRYRRRGGDSLGSVVDDSAHIASRFGPIGAMTTGAVGFTIFYAAIPLGLIAWTDANKAKLVGPATTVFANLLDQVMWQRFIGPCQCAGLAILLVCWAIAAWKAFFDDALTDEELAGASWAAKLLAWLLRKVVRTPSRSRSRAVPNQAPQSPCQQQCPACHDVEAQPAGGHLLGLFARPLRVSPP